MCIKSIKQLGKNDVAIAGGKGASLGEMTKAGIPVPPGFVVLASAFDKFWGGIGTDLARRRFRDGKFDELVKKAYSEMIEVDPPNNNCV